MWPREVYVVRGGKKIALKITGGIVDAEGVMFYNTGIATYVWVLTNHKPEHRRGKVQLIDATNWYQSLRKNLGSKNCELGTSLCALHVSLRSLHL